MWSVDKHMDRNEDGNDALHNVASVCGLLEEGYLKLGFKISKDFIRVPMMGKGIRPVNKS